MTDTLRASLFSLDTFRILLPRPAPRHIAVLVCRQLNGFPSQHRSDRLQPNCFLQLLALVFDCQSLRLRADHSQLFTLVFFLTPHTRVWLPVSSIRPSWLDSEAYYSHPATHHSHVHRHLHLKLQDVPHAFEHDCACRSSHLFPPLYFKDLLPSRLLLLPSPSAHPHTFGPKERSHP